MLTHSEPLPWWRGQNSTDKGSFVNLCPRSRDGFCWCLLYNVWCDTLSGQEMHNGERIASAVPARKPYFGSIYHGELKSPEPRWTSIWSSWSSWEHLKCVQDNRCSNVQSRLSRAALCSCCCGSPAVIVRYTDCPSQTCILAVTITAYSPWKLVSSVWSRKAVKV